MAKNQLNEMISLINRMDNPQSGWATLLKEAMQKATRIEAPSMEVLLSKNLLKEGDLCCLGYIQLYSIPGKVPSDDLYNQMMDMGSEINNDRAKQNFDAYMDKAKNDQWNNPTGRKIGGAPTLGTKLYSHIIKVSRYILHWQGEEGYKRAQERYSTQMSNLTQGWPDDWKAEVGYNPQKPDGEYTQKGHFFMAPENQFGIATYGTKTRDADGNITMNAVKGSYFTDPDDESSRKEYSNFAIKNRLSRPEDNLESVYFGVYENGDIDPIPHKLGKLLHGVSSSSNRADAGDDVAKQDAFKAYYDFKDNERFLQKDFLLSNVAYFCFTAKDMSTGIRKSNFWVNKNPLFLLEKTVNKEKIKYLRHINEEELEQTLAMFAEKEADNLEVY